MKKLLISLVALSSLSLLQGVSAQEDKPIVIGVNMELSGRMAPTGHDTLRGIEAAHAQDPEVLGRSVKLSVCDNASTVQGSVACANRFIGEGVAAVLGSYSSSHSIPAGEVLQDAGVVMVSTGSTNPATTKIGEYIFRTPYTDEFQGKVAAQYAYNELDARNVAIFRQQDDDYSVGLTGFFQRELERLGGNTTVVDFTANTVDFSAQIGSLRAFQPDMIYYTGFCAEAASLVPQLRRQGFAEIPIMGADASDDSQCPEGGGAAFDGFLFTSFGGPEVLSGEAAERAKDFGKFFKEMHGDDAPYNGFVLTGADSYKVVMEAIEQAGSADPAAVQKELAELKDFPGVSGTITYAGTDGTPANRVMGLFRYQVEDDGSWEKVTLRGITLGQ